MASGPAETLRLYLQQQQAEGKIILPGELVRRVKAGPGPASLGEAQNASALQAQEQQSIESDTMAAVGRLEAAWSGQSGDAARAGLRPLADVAASASTALNNSQNALTDQSHAFQSTRDSMQDVSDDPPSRGVVDVVTPWDTDTEDQINQRNAAIQQNNQIYQSFTSTSDGHAQKMPTDYGQVPDTPQGTFAVQQPSTGPDSGIASGTDAGPWSQSSGQDSGPTSFTSHSGPGNAPAGSSPGQHQAGGGLGGSSGEIEVPAASTDDSTGTSGFVPPAEPGTGGSRGTDAVRLGPIGSGSSSTPGTGSGFGGAFVRGAPGSVEPVPGAGSGANTPGTGSRSGVLGGPGRSTGAGRFGAVEEPVVKGGPGTTGARGANGVPMGAGAGKGSKEEDKEKKSAPYLLEPDPNALFGYDGKATPPVIGK